MPDSTPAFPGPFQVATSWVRAVTDLMFPPLCPLCRRRLERGEFVACTVCRAELSPQPDWHCRRCGSPGHGIPPTGDKRCQACPPIDSPWQGAFPVTRYWDLPARAVHLFKYGRRTDMGELLARLMRERIAPSLEKLGKRLDLVAPVPLHPLRRFSRGFNQSDLLAAELATAAGLPYEKKLMRRVRWTRRQALVPHERRAANVRGAFALNGRLAVRDLGILLVDDVVTTGYTINECARVLRDAGAREVWVACFARAGVALDHAGHE